jgi:hypothetical protein
MAEIGFEKGPSHIYANSSTQENRELNRVFCDTNTNTTA